MPMKEKHIGHMVHGNVHLNPLQSANLPYEVYRTTRKGRRQPIAVGRLLVSVLILTSTVSIILGDSEI